MISSKLTGQVNKLLDIVMQKFEADRDIIFESLSERSALLHGYRADVYKSWRKTKTCIVPGCGCLSIARSHAVPRAMSLAPICANGKVLTPKIDARTRRVSLQLEGQFDASTFPGFCLNHEALFEAFESTGSIASDNDVLLQTYRAVCREKFRTDFFLKRSEGLILEYEKLRDKRLFEMLKREAKKLRVPEDVDFKNFRMSNDPVIDKLQDRVGALRQWNLQVSSKVLPAFEKALFEGKSSDVFVSALKLPIKIPVALQGTGNFRIQIQEKTEEHSAIVCCVPSVSETVLIVAGHASQSVALGAYVDQGTGNMLAALSMVETWMVNGTDQWYLEPAVWESLDEDRAAHIEDAIFSCDENIGAPLQYSIFDSLRKQLIAQIETLNLPAARDLLVSEAGKLSAILPKAAREPHF